MSEHDCQEESLQQPEETVAQDKKKAAKQELMEWIRTFCFVLAFVILVRTFIFVPAMVSGSSMYPTLVDSEMMFVTRFVTYAAEPQRGDIVILTPPDKKLGFNQFYVKRIIGMPGETIVITNGQVFIDGEMLDEPYIKSDWSGGMNPVTLPQDCYFVMGDNRGASTDSRSFGPLHKSLIGGKTEAVILPFGAIRKIEHATYE